MDVILFLVPWVLVGTGVIFVALSGGPGAARSAYLTGGNRAFRVAIPLIYIGTGIAVPALVIANRGEAEGATDKLASAEISKVDERGKQLFRDTCSSCHNLDAVNARGVFGPDLDQIGEMTPKRLLAAIRNGGTGQDLMPAGLLEGENAKLVAEYVTKVAGE